MNYEYMTEEEELISMGEETTNPMDHLQPQEDMVNHPPHYKSDNGVECIDAIKAALGDEFNAYCRGTAMKYIWRTGKKWDADEDIKKAIWYLGQIVK